MIIKNKFEDYTIECDGCSDYVDTIESEPEDAWREAQREGWYREYDVASYCYMHYCPDCWSKKNER